MLEKLDIKNFQSHKDTVLEFSPGVNAIVGDSDSGKTAILRALNWVMTNKPLGDAFRSTWDQKGVTSVKLTTEGKTIERKKKGVTENLYKIGKKEYKSFKQGIPEDVASLLNIDDINIQYQMDGPFLLSGMSPGEVGRYFNKLAKIDKIDKATAAANRELRRIKTTFDHEEEKLGKKTALLEENEWIPEADELLKQIEADHNETVKAQIQWDELSIHLDKIDDVQVKIEPLEKLLLAEDKVNSLLKIEKEVREKLREKDELGRTISRIEMVEKNIAFCNALLKAEKEVNKLIALSQEMDQKYQEHKQLADLMDQIEAKEVTIVETQERIDKLEAEIEAEMPDVCPLCGKPK
jgi:DNA repair protein SbcC/Rad50